MSKSKDRQIAIPAERQRGVSLIEVLVSLVILGLGVLSVVALQLVSKRNTGDAGAQQLASQLSYGTIERMRMNNSVVALTQYEVAASNGIGGGQQGTTEPSPTCASGSPCLPTQLATHDIWVLEQMLDGANEVVGSTKTGGLVNPIACITGPASGGAGVYTVTIVWKSKTPIPNPASYDNTFCGYHETDASGNSLYGTATDCQTATGNAGATADCFRRAVQIQAYI